jgi:phosphate transport system substrate-binding protein
MLIAACGPGTNPGPASKPAETKPSDAPKPTEAAAKPTAASSPAAAVGASPAAAAASPAAASGSPVAGASPAAGGAAAASAGPGLGAVKGPFDGEAKQLTGAGATFPAPLYTKWFSDYKGIAGVEVNYQAIGSGGGIKAITDKTVDFGASDAPMTDEQLKAAGAPILHIPMTLGAVVPIVNIPELKDQALKFSGETLAGIFLGTISKWNDDKIKADNAGVNLPNQEIISVHRADGSGTTAIFTDYLSNVSADWKSKIGMNTSVNWPNGLGGQGNPGVANEITQNPYSIGYVELIYALQQNLKPGHMKNKEGNFVEPTIESVTAAAAGLTTIPDDLRISIVNAPGAQAYPISGFTWILAFQEMAEKAKAIALTRLLYWAIFDGQKYSADLHYAPMPPVMVQKAEAKILSIKSGGAQAFPGR